MEEEIEEIFVEGIMAEEVDIGEIKEQDMTPVLLEDLGMLYATEESKRKSRFGLFECPYCGKEFKTVIASVKRGDVRGCGCLNGVNHGLSKNWFYSRWNAMIQRCYNPKHQAYHTYEARGIKICDEWLIVKNFIEWAEETYIEGYTIDRIDNDKGYSSDNCRWADASTQNINQRKQKNNTSGYVGIGWNKQISRWKASIYINKKRIDLGHFKDKMDAVKARDSYIKKNDLSHKLSTEY